MPSTTASLTLWRFIDGKPGHEKQSLGLARAFERLIGARRHDIAAPGSNLAALASVWHWGLRRFPPGRALPKPDLILAAGHTTHWPALAARRAHGGRIVVLMRPSLPLALFDLCLIPAHDRPKSRANVIVTRGVLNAVLPGTKPKARRGLFLIGGPSRHYQWDTAAIVAQVREILKARPDLVWTLTTSRRTPADFLSALGTPAGLTLKPQGQTPPGWLEAELAASAEVWASPDSGSMVYEALTAGCAVGLMQLTPQPASRIADDMAALAAQGWVTPLSLWRQRQRLSAPPAGFNEAERCAGLILERWYA